MIQLQIGERPRVVNCGLVEHGFRGQEEYQLPNLWCLHLYFYEVEMEVSGEMHRIIPGSLTLIPPGTRIVYKYGHKRHRHFFVHFAVRSKGSSAEVPLLQHVPDGQDEILDRLQNMQRVLTQNAFHAEILFWALLCDLVESGRRQPLAEKGRASVLKRLDEFVEKHLPAKISVAEVATQFGITPTQVNRIVKGQLGMTTIQLIKKRRLERAYRFLAHSTMPIKLIAAECGLADLHQFNKLIRGAYGKSPRELRNQLSSEAPPTWALERD